MKKKSDKNDDLSEFGTLLGLYRLWTEPRTSAWAGRLSDPDDPHPPKKQASYEEITKALRLGAFHEISNKDRLTKVNKEKADKISPVKNAYIKEAERILKKAPGMKKHTVIFNIKKKIKHQLSDKTIERYIKHLFPAKNPSK